LEIAVDRDDRVAARLIEAGNERGGFAEVPAQPNDSNVLHLAVEPRERGERSVGRAVVDEDRLPVLAHGFERRTQLVVEEGDTSLLVMDGDDDRDHGARLLAFRLHGRMAGLLSLADAHARVLACARVLGTEEIDVADAAGRFLANAARAVVDLPPFPSSAMDGFALRTDDTPGRLQVVARIAAGVPAPRALRAGEAMAIATGGVVPEGADAVVPIEYVVESDNEVEIDEAVARMENVRPRAGDVRRGDVVVERGTRIGAAQVGALAAAGIARVECGRSPRVAILTTGTELQRPGTPLEPGQVYEANSAMLAAALSATGATVNVHPSVPDDEDSHRRALDDVLGSDVVVTSGGVSVGPHDLVRRILRELGVREEFWGVAVKPGKPVSFGVRDGTLVFGLPGNPVSSLVACELFVRPAVRALQAASDPGPSYELGRVATTVRRNRRRDEFVRARRTITERGALLEPIRGQESHMIARAAAANALLFVPLGEGEIAAGETVRYLVLD
jgi:molybdopterin molybdotransferase